jgi:predicted kinase
MLSGLPASGKSTYAEDLVKNSGGGWVRVNKDLIRTMLHADKFTYSNEKETVFAEKELAIAMLSRGKNVIVDDTNLGERHENMWKGVVKEFNDTRNENEPVVTFSKRRFKTSFEECLRRNANRGYKVPQSAIHRMATQYKMIDGHWKDVVICDIDGTVGDLSHRLHHIKHENPEDNDYDAFYSYEQVINDGYRNEICQKVLEEHLDGKTIIFVSGRSDVCREATEEWLKGTGVPYSALLMRAEGDKRPDTEVKKDFLLQTLKDYNIVKVYDDRPSVIRMWREHGLEVIDCGDGVEF